MKEKILLVWNQYLSVFAADRYFNMKIICMIVKREFYQRVNALFSG